MLIVCPNCRTRVWISENGQCPSCRTQVPDEILLRADEESSSPPTDSQPVEPALPTRRVVRRTSWLGVIFGSFVVLLAVMLFFVQQKGGVSHSTSRRVHAIERAIGTEATTYLGQLVAITLGIWLIYASRLEMIEGEASPGAAHTCDLCDKTSAESTEGFVTVAGGPELISNAFRWLSPAFERKYGSKHRFPGAFQCRICDSCARASRSLFRAHILQAILMGSAVIAVPLASYTTILLFAAPNKNAKPGSEILIAVIWGIALFHAISIPLLLQYISRGTCRLLGPRLDPMIRRIVGIECWGWRRCVMLSRFVSPNAPMIDVTQK